MLQLKNILKKYNTNLILEVPFLQLEPGIYWVKGANGSGKTTFLKTIAGLLPFEGDILLNDISLKKEPVLYRKQVSWSEAEPLFPLFLTGLDLIRLYRSIRSVPEAEATVMLQLLNMSDYVHQPIGTYSAGMTKKLSLLLAFLGNLPLIVLDEPLITLDAATFTSVCTFIYEKHSHAGTSFIMSSHQDLDTRLLLAGKELSISNKSIQNK